MQHVPSGVFQKLQQQRESQTRQEGRELGSDDARRSRGYKRPHAPSSSPVSLSTTDLALASLSSSETSLHREPKAQSLRRPQAQRETSRRRLRTKSSSEQPIPSGAGSVHQRSGPGSRTPSPTPRESASTQVPSQLLGGRAGSNASVLRHTEPTHAPENIPESPVSDKSTFTYHVAQQEATAEQLRSLLSSKKNNG